MGTEHLLAYKVMADAIKAGALPRAGTQRCVTCGEPAAHWHHHKGYAPEFALAVEPLCVPCHQRAHTHRRRDVAPTTVQNHEAPSPVPGAARRPMHRLRPLRLKQAMTQMELAEASGVGIVTIRRLEGGDTRPRQPATMRKLAAALGVKVTVLTQCGPASTAEAGK